MPTSMLLRTLTVTTFLSFPRLVGLCLPAMERLSRTQAWLICPDKNPFLKSLIKVAFYNNFAAGENEAQVQQAVARLKAMGCYGVILGYARETMAEHADCNRTPDDNLTRKQIEQWKAGNLRTVGMVSETDFVGIKFTGAGEKVAKALMAKESPPPEFRHAMEEVIEATIAKGARIVIDAEQWVYQDTIDQWILNWMRKYNIPSNMTANGPPIYNTMQAYLKSTPQRVAEHLKLAQRDNFTLAFKLVRGAYIVSEKRSLIHDTKSETDQAYDTIIEHLITESFPGVEDPFPAVRFVVAGHNDTSVERALAVQQKEVQAGRCPRGLEFGQIQGMADEITCNLAQMRNRKSTADSDSIELLPRVYKALSWGTVQELMQNLIRRAIENRAAVERTKEWRHGLWKELVHRIRRNMPLLSH